jgi:hypothetical protein
VVLNRPGPDPKLPAVIQVAMLDSVGTVRGTGVQPMELLQQQWKDAKPQEFADATKLKQWQEGWPADSKQPAVKILYNRDTGELVVNLQIKGRPSEVKAFPVQNEQELPSVLQTVKTFIDERTR